MQSRLGWTLKPSENISEYDAPKPNTGNIKHPRAYEKGVQERESVTRVLHSPRQASVQVLHRMTAPNLIKPLTHPKPYILNPLNPLNTQNPKP